MTTPYDRRILVANWRGCITPGNSIADLAALLRSKVPNVAGMMLRTSNGVSWEGHLGDSGPKAVTGVTRIQEWVETFGGQGLEVHVWGKPRAKRPPGAERSPDLEREAERFARAATVPGVKSLLLDVEHGELYWQGTPDEVSELMSHIRAAAGDVHVGMILDGRRNRDFSFYVDPWIPFVDSLHPMVYPIWFGGHRTIEEHLDVAFRNLEGYGKPIVPMLQAFGQASRRPTPEEITRQGHSAWARGAAGISFFRLGTDVWATDHKPQMGDPEYAGIAQVRIPGEEPAPAYIWQNVINAAATVGARVDADWEAWFESAGVWRFFDNSLRRQPYSGPAIEFWPIAPELRQQILELVVLDPSDLARITAAAQAERERREQEEAARRRRRRGSTIGIHGAPGVAAPPRDTWEHWAGALKEMGIKWYKQCDNGDPNDTGPNSIFGWSRYLKGQGIEPIIRYFVPYQFPDPLPDPYFQKMQHYAAEGIVWAEIGNEPNLLFEWKGEWTQPHDHPRMRFGNPEAVRLVAETWVTDAQRALQAGVRPAFYAFAPTDWRGGYHPWFSSVWYTRKVVEYLAQHRRAETIDILGRGGWIAVHSATYEQPIDFDPSRPDGTVWDMALRGYEVVLRAFDEYFGDALDVDELAIMSTEGGVFTPESTSMEGHQRLATDQEHAQQVVEMFRWLERHSPLQAMCPWCLSVGGKIGHFHDRFQFDGWIQETNGQLQPRAVYEAMRQLRFDHEREEEEQDPAHAGIKLDVPYISQFDETARTHKADCGPACVAMILNADKPLAEQVTVDELYTEYLPHKGVGEFTFMSEMAQISRGEGVAAQIARYSNATEGFEALRALVQQNTPFVILVNYGKWDDIAGNNFAGGHFVVVTGFDDEHVFVHDPLFRGTRRNQGAFFVWRNQHFLDGWGGCHESGNPDFLSLIPQKQVPRLRG